MMTKNGIRQMTNKGSLEKFLNKQGFETAKNKHCVDNDSIEGFKIVKPWRSERDVRFALQDIRKFYNDKGFIEKETWVGFMLFVKNNLAAIICFSDCGLWAMLTVTLRRHCPS